MAPHIHDYIMAAVAKQGTPCVNNTNEAYAPHLPIFFFRVIVCMYASGYYTHEGYVVRRASGRIRHCWIPPGQPQEKGYDTNSLFLCRIQRHGIIRGRYAWHDGLCHISTVPGHYPLPMPQPPHDWDCFKPGRLCKVHHSSTHAGWRIGHHSTHPVSVPIRVCCH